MNGDMYTCSINLAVATILVALYSVPCDTDVGLNAGPEGVRALRWYCWNAKTRFWCIIIWCN